MDFHRYGRGHTMEDNTENNRLKVAIIGCGRVSEKHIRAINRLSDRLILCALVDTNPDAPSHLLSSCRKKIKKYAEFTASIKKYIDYKEMLSDLKPDIVAITVPSGLHFQVAKDCLQSGIMQPRQNKRGRQAIPGTLPACGQSRSMYRHGTYLPLLPHRLPHP